MMFQLPVTSADAGIPGLARLQNFYDLRSERSESTYNVPHSLLSAIPISCRW